MITIIVVLALLSPPPPLTATWESPGVAGLSWHGAGCLYHQQALCRCHEESGVLLLGGVGPLDGAYRVHPHDIFRLVRMDGSVEVAQIGTVVYFPVFRA